MPKDIQGQYRIPFPKKLVRISFEESFPVWKIFFTLLAYIPVRYFQQNLKIFEMADKMQATNKETSSRNNTNRG